jgi:hypothetical protein
MRSNTLRTCAAFAVTIPVAAIHAQTHDESRLVIGISAGWIGSAPLWDVPNQPVYSSVEPGNPSIYHLTSTVQSNLTVSGSATYFGGGGHVGLTGEFTYLGLGTTDGCVLTHDDGDAFLEAACTYLQGHESSSSTTAVQGGLLLRPFTRTGVQPYVKGMVGVTFTPESPITTVATTGFLADTAYNLTVYTDDSWKEIHPTWTAGFGVSTAPGAGYQIHAEIRETWAYLSEITGPSAGQGYVPPHRTVIKGFPSILIGFDVVLEQRRGRRY